MLCAGHPDQIVHLGIRPEHLAISPSRADSIPAKVLLVEPTGAATQVLVEMAGCRASLLSTRRHDFRPDQIISVVPELDHIHLFDALSGESLMP
ncbi:MAG: TOBE domain-containing protein [Aliidongia sp.]